MISSQLIKRCYFYLEKDEETLVDHLKDTKNDILDLFRKTSNDINKNKVLKSRERRIEKIITKNHGYSMKVPFGWNVAKDHIDFVWLRELDYNQEKTYLSINNRTKDNPISIKLKS